MKETQKREDEEKAKQGVFKIEVKQEVVISKEDFKEYISCRNGGLTNMFNLSNVEIIT